MSLRFQTPATPSGSPSAFTLLVQWKWGSRSSMGSEDPREPEHPSPATSSKTVPQAQYQSPDAKHTFVPFLDTPAIPSYSRKRSDSFKSIPPISLTAPRAVQSHGGVRLNLQRRTQLQRSDARSRRRANQNPRPVVLCQL
jgi:hypothetical protein